MRRAWSLVAAWTLALVIVVLVGATPTGAAEAGAVVDRTAGAGRIETAVAVSRRLFPCLDGTGEGCPEQVILVRDDDPADALLAGPLARSLDATLLLTGRDRLSGVVRDEITRTGVGAVVLLGGPAALSVALEAEIVALGVQVDRVAGADRYETAAQVARRVAPGVLAVASGAAADPVDALVAGAWAGATGGAVLLTADDQLPDTAAAAIRELSPSRVVVVGGPAAVGEGVLVEIAELVEVEPERVGGPDRFATAALLSATAPPLGADQSVSWLANGYS